MYIVVTFVGDVVDVLQLYSKDGEEPNAKPFAIQGFSPVASPAPRMEFSFFLHVPPHHPVSRLR